MGVKQENHGKGRTKREAARLLERRAAIFERWRAGESQSSIAASLKISPATVSLDLGAAWREWRESVRGSISEHVEREVDLLNRSQLQAEAEWEKSSDPRFLELVLSCSDRRRKLLGLDAPSRSEVKQDVALSRQFVPKEQMQLEISQSLRRFREQQARKENQNGDND